MDDNTEIKEITADQWGLIEQVAETVKEGFLHIKKEADAGDVDAQAFYWLMLGFQILYADKKRSGNYPQDDTPKIII